jgi:hypothetical protein
VPDDLNEAEAKVWRAVVDSKPREWFGEDSAPLLREYVRAICMCDFLEERIKALLETNPAPKGFKSLLDMRDKESRRASSLATRLRLTQQSRYTPQAAGTASKKAAGKRPWQA